VLVGGLMVQLYALEAGVDDIRVTMDVDVLGQGRPPGALAAIDEALSYDGFELQLPAEGVVRRYLRGDLIVDVLVPDGMRDGIGVPGGSQALARPESGDHSPRRTDLRAASSDASRGDPDQGAIAPHPPRP
jgi:hypothetical protein